MGILNTITDLYRTTRPKPWPLEKPTVIQFPVNDICNSKCQMCQIWEKKLDYQLSPEELEHALKNPLFSRVRDIGINGGEPTLRSDLAEITDVLFRTLPSLKTISLITNALISKTVIQRIEEMGRVIRQHKGCFDVMVSLDGVGEVHDRVRGRAGNFAQAATVIDFIKKSPLVTSCRLGCTVIRDNVYGLHDLLDFAIEKNAYIKFRLGVPHQRLYNLDHVKDFALSDQEKIHFGVFLENVIRHYEQGENQKFFYRSLIGQLLYNRPRQAGCDWQHRGATITSRGELLYCAVASKKLGSIISEDSEANYFRNVDHLRDIVNHTCAGCAHDYVGLPPGPIYRKQLIRRILQKTGLPWETIKSSPLLAGVRAWSSGHRFQNRLKDFSQIRPERATTRTAGPAKRVMICGWYGTETLGDKAILGGTIMALKQAWPDSAVQIVSLEPYISRLTVAQMPELKDVSVISTEEGIKQVSSASLIVFGGGPLMALHNLAEMVTLFRTAKEHNVPTVIGGCGVGPFGATFHNQAITELLSLATCRIYRDQRSLESAASLGINTRQDLVSEDPSLTWLADKRVKKAKDDNSRKLLLGLRDWPSGQYAPHLSPSRAGRIKQQFEESLLQALTQLINKHQDLSIIPFPMCTNHLGGDDRWYYRRLFRDQKDLRARMDYSVLSRELSPSEAVDVFQKADTALTMRYHATLFALAFTIPTLAVDYTLKTGKIAALTRQQNLTIKSLDEVSTDFLVATIDNSLAKKKGGPDAGKVPAPVFAKKLAACLEKLK